MTAQTTAPHTPTPWKNINGAIFQLKENGQLERDALSICGSRTSTEIDRANAEFIIKAVNSHEALLKAAKEAFIDLREMGHANDYDGIVARCPDGCSLCLTEEAIKISEENENV